VLQVLCQEVLVHDLMDRWTRSASHDQR